MREAIKLHEMGLSVSERRRWNCSNINLLLYLSPSKKHEDKESILHFSNLRPVDIIRSEEMGIMVIVIGKNDWIRDWGEKKSKVLVEITGSSTWKTWERSVCLQPESSWGEEWEGWKFLLRKWDDKICDLKWQSLLEYGRVNHCVYFHVSIAYQCS